MRPARSTPRWSFFQPLRPLPPCLAAVHDQMQRTCSYRAIQLDVEGLRSARQSRLIGCLEFRRHQVQQRPQEALRLTQRKVVHETECEGRLDGNVRESSLSAALPRGCGFPGIDRVLRDPERDVPTRDERPVVRRPVAYAVLRFFVGCTLARISSQYRGATGRGSIRAPTPGKGRTGQTWATIPESPSCWSCYP